jgi:hypothetical protein
MHLSVVPPCTWWDLIGAEKVKKNSSALDMETKGAGLRMSSLLGKKEMKGWWGHRRRRWGTRWHRRWRQMVADQGCLHFPERQDLSTFRNLVSRGKGSMATLLCRICGWCHCWCSPKKFLTPTTTSNLAQHELLHRGKGIVLLRMHFLYIGLLN